MQALSDDLIDGAKDCAEYIYGSSEPAKVRKVFRLAASGDIPVIRKSNRMYFRKSELDRAFQSQEA